MSVTKANQLSEYQYLHLLDVAKSLRGAYLRLSKDNCYRVYTEARKNGSGDPSRFQSLPHIRRSQLLHVCAIRLHTVAP